MEIQKTKDVNEFFNDFMFIDDKLNIIVKVKYFTKSCDYDKLSTYIFSIIENTIKQRKKIKNIEVLDILIDLKDYKIKEINYGFIKLMINFCQDKYKDNLRVIYLKHSNFMFKAIYAIIRPFIDTETRKKIFFIKKGKNKKITEEKIDDLFD
jgi:hypothetical protein